MNAPQSRWLGQGWLLFTLAAAAVAAALAVLILRQAERTALSARFSQIVSDHHTRIVERLSEPIERLRAVGALFESSDVVTAAEFRRFTTQLQQGAPSRFVFAWAPRVARADRAAFEAARRREGRDGFTIVQSDAGGDLVAAPDRDEYFPLLYVSDPGGAARLGGFDPTWDRARRVAIEAARDSGEVTATEPVRLVARPHPTEFEDTPAEGCVFIYPVYVGDRPTEVAARRRGFAGFAAVPIAFDQTLAEAAEGLSAAGIRVIATDDTAGGRTTLSRNADEGTAPWWSYIPVWTPTLPEDVRSFELAGRRWTVRYTPTRHFYGIHGTERPELGLAAASALFLLLAAYLMARQREVRRLAAAEAAVRRSETHFRSLIEAGSAVILALDADGRIIEWNPAAERVFGVSREEAVGVHYAERFLPASERSRVETEIARVQAGGTSQGYENAVVSASGEQRIFAWNSAPFSSQPGGRDGLIAIGNDITESRRMEQERQRMERKFLESQRLESLEVLAGGVAHDFNNLLFVVLGNTDLALGDLAPDAPAREAVLEIRSAAERASHLAGLMLAYSGRGHFRLEPTDLNAAVEEALESLPLHLAEGITLERRLSTESLLVRGDARQLRQLTTTLVVNAAEAIVPPGRITVSTGVVHATERLAVVGDDEGRPPGRYVRLRVADTGSGMNADVLTRIFDPFYSTKFVGRGLGLPAARGILRGHRAHIAVTSTPGHGSEFAVYFTGSGLESDGVRSGK